jgi:hypothetical protein
VAGEPDRGPSAVAVGARGVAVAGDVTGSVIVTGDNVDVRLLVGSEHGALIEKLSRMARPTKELRRVPLRNIPEQPADSIDRADEAHAIATGDVSSRNTLNVYGGEGIGKTYALLRALSEEQSRIAGKSVYVYAAGALGDVLQDVFDAFYERSPPSRSSAGELRRDLGKVSGVVILDAVEMDREAGQQLQLVLVRCSLVVVSRERVIWGDATPLQIRGLEPEFAIALIERELGRALEEPERGPAERICAALAGHPLRIREAVAPVRADGRSLSQIADAIAGPGAPKALAASLLAGADAQHRQLLATLAPFGGQAVGHEHLAALLDTPDAPELIDGAVASGDLRAHSPRYSLGLTAADAARSLDPAAAGVAGDRALAYFVRWAHDTHDQPQAQLVEGAALLALLRWAADNGRLREAIELGRAIDAAFAVGRRFDAWRELLELVRSAARETEDRAAEAWAVHQLGTRALALGELATGTVLLQHALAMRRELGDGVGAGVTERNLGVSRRLARARQAIWRNPFLLLLIAGLVAVGLATAVSGSHHKPPLQNGGGPDDHNIVTVSRVDPQQNVVHSTVALQIRASDSGDAKLTYAAAGLPTGLQVKPSTGLITGSPGQTGTYQVTVGASDPTGANRNAKFVWTIIPGIARTVSVSKPAPQTGPAGKPVTSLQIKASDSAGAPLTFAAFPLPAGLKISSSGLIGGTPTTPGSSAVTVTAKDASGASGATTFSWTITPSKSANPITIAPPGNQSNSVHSFVKVPIVAGEAGQPTLSYAASGLPKGLSINAQSGLISGLPDEPGTYAVTVNVSDPAGHENQTNFSWTITRLSTGTATATGTGTSTSTSSSTSPASSTSTVIP